MLKNISFKVLGTTVTVKTTKTTRTISFTQSK